LYTKAKTALIQYPIGKTSITFAIPNSVTSIEQLAFSQCKSLTSITIPNSVTSIGWGAFDGCTSLTSVTIPDSVTSIGNRAFRFCARLTSVTFEGTIASENFEYGDSDSPIFPGDLRDKYLASDGGPGTYRRFANAETWRKQ